MKASLRTIGAMAVAIGCAMSSGCDRDTAEAANGVTQTKFPGQVTAGGPTSGQVMAATAKPEVNAVYGGGSPFIAGGSGGNTGGAELGGTVTETGQGPAQGVTDPSGAMQGGRMPLGDNGRAPAGAPAAGVTPIGDGVATNVKKPLPDAPAAGAAGNVQQPNTPVAPGTVTGDK